MKKSSERPYVTVGGLIIAPDGDVLLVRSAKWNNLYTLPGGKVEPGETLEAAFVREVKEETNLDIVDVEFAYVQQSIFSQEYHNPSHFLMHEFIGKLSPNQKKEDVVLNDEGESYLWVSPEKARSLSLNRETYVLLDWLTARNSTCKLGFEGLKLECLVGIYDHEKIAVQPLYIDLSVIVECSAAANSDQIQDTIDYDKLAEICRQTAAEKHHHLLESYANSVINKIKDAFRVFSIRIKVRKPMAIQESSGAFVEIEWRKSCVEKH